MKKSLLILLFTCWALFFAAFRPVMPFAAETAAFPDGTPVTGGRILMGTIGEPSNLIPYMASDSASGEITGLLYVAPLKYDKDLNVVPWAAASYEVLEGGRLLHAPAQTSCRRRGMVGTPLQKSGTETHRPWGILRPGEVQGYPCFAFRCRSRFRGEPASA